MTAVSHETDGIPFDYPPAGPDMDGKQRSLTWQDGETRIRLPNKQVTRMNQLRSIA